MTDTAPRTPPPIAWHWSFFLLGVVYALPAVLVTPFHPIGGLGLAVGVLPVAAFNLPAARRGRRIIPLIGSVSAVCFVVGSLLTQNPIVAVIGLFVLAFVFTQWAQSSRAGVVALVLCLPMIGIALSFDDIALAAGVAALIVVGSVYAWGVALLWPEHDVPLPARDALPSRADAVIYGLLLGAAAATSTAFGYALGYEHVGWATGSTLLVMRPVPERLVRRSLARSAGVLVGALAAASLALIAPPSVVTALAVGAVLGAMTATQASRWYVAPAFTSFVVLTLILQVPGELPGQRFVERVVETGLGVGVALVFGALIPALIRSARQQRQKGLRP